MDQNSGDGEPNSSEGRSSEQCKKKYGNDGEMAVKAISILCNDSDKNDVSSAPVKGPMATVFNVGAAPFVSTTSAIQQTAPTSSNGSSGDNERVFPWKGIGATSTPRNDATVASNNKQTTLHQHNGGIGRTPKEETELCNLMNTLAIAVPGRGSTLKHMDAKADAGSTPLPGNILRHLNNNNIMGNLLQETNPPPQGIHLGPRSASDYRAYFNSNFINGNNEHLLNNVHGGFVPRTLAINNTANQLPPVPMAQQIMGNGNGLYQYRLDLEENNNTNNNCQRNIPSTGNMLPTTGPHPSPMSIANPGNQFHHVRNVGGVGIGPQPNIFGEERFFVGNQDGIIQLKLKDGIEIEMTLDGAIRVVNWRCNVSISLASSSNSAALIHPNGRILQYHSRVEIMTYDGKNKNNFVRFAKIWYKGISFTSENNALVYLVDSGGTRTTTDTFMDLRNDITEQVFLTGSTHGPAYDNQARKEVANHKYWPALDGTEVHELNGFRIAQTVDGMVRITKANKNILVRTSPGNGSATLTTAYIHCTASLGQTSHLFVRRGERRMHFDGAEFVVRNSGHSAGFDSNNLLRVY